MSTDALASTGDSSASADYEIKISSYLEEIRSISRELSYYPYLSKLADRLDEAFFGLTDCVLMEIASKERMLSECQNEARRLFDRSVAWKKLGEI